MSAGAAGSILAACGGDRLRRRPRRHRLPRARLRPRRRRPKSPPRRLLPENARHRKAALRFRIRATSSPSTRHSPRARARRRPPPGSTRDCLRTSPGRGSRQPARRDVRAVADGLQFIQAEASTLRGLRRGDAEDVKFSFERVAVSTDQLDESPYWVTGWPQEVRVDGKYEEHDHPQRAIRPADTHDLPAYYGGSILSKKAVTELGEDYALNPSAPGRTSSSSGSRSSGCLSASPSGAGRRASS